MRISFFSDTFLPEVNGVTTVLAVMRDRLRARGHDVRMIVPAYETVTTDESGLQRIPGVPCPGYAAVRLSWPWGRGLGRTTDEFEPHVVHVATEGPIGAFGRRYARHRSLPLVTSFHTDFPRYAARYLGPWAAEPVRQYLRWFHQSALATQTPSGATRDELRAMGLSRAMIWGRGVDSAWFRPARRSEVRRADLGAAGRPIVLHVGRLAVEKDVATLVAAFRLASDRLGAQAVFCVAGDGPQGAMVREALPFARHLGFLPRERLADLYADADLFVFPSPTETCGLVALEAMASGLPVIGADAGGVRESIIPDITGVTVPPGDAEGFASGIHSLVQDGERRQAMGQAARAFAVGRDWERELDELEAVYQSATLTNSAMRVPTSWPTTTSVT